MNKQQYMRFLRLVIVIGVTIGSYLLIYYTTSFIYPILIAIIFSFFLHPFVSMLENKLHLPRPIATLIAMIGIFTILIGLIILIITEIYQGTMYLAEQIPSYYQTFILFIEDFLNTKIIPIYEKILSLFYTLDDGQQQTIQENLDELISSITSSGATVLQNMFQNIPAFLSFLPNSLTVVIFVVLATFIITNDWLNLQQVAGRLIPGQANRGMNSIIHHLKKALGGFFRAQIILISITACFIFIGLQVLGIEHALTIALLASIAELIPYVGIGIIFIPWIVYLFITAEYSLTIGLSILYMVITITRQVIEPKILSSNIGVNPLAALIGMFIGIQLWGLFGIIIAPILLVIISAFHQAGVTKWIWNYVKG